MANLATLQKKLQTALIQSGHQVRVETHQFYSEEQNRMINQYHISEREYDDEKGKYVYADIMKSCSRIEVVKCLAEMYQAVRDG